MSSPIQAVETARSAFKNGRTLDIKFRTTQLKNLIRMYEENEDALVKSSSEGVQKPKHEALMYEIFMVLSEFHNILRNLESWATPEDLPMNIGVPTEKVQIRRDPYGLVLILGTWNYPLMLSLIPLAGAIAAGNCVILKPSEISPVASSTLAKLIPAYLDPECYHVVEGGHSVVEKLLEQRFDYIFYTGSTRVGRLIHAAANRHLTPTTLELGGKNPVYIDDTVELKHVIKRLLWGKLVNLGQACVAPDYVLCSKEIEEKLVAAAPGALNSWHGTCWKDSPYLSRMGNDQQFKRLRKALEATNGKIICGGDTDETQRWISPTIVVDVSPDDSLMQEEIFGPVLPFLTVNSVQEAIDFINEREKPLSLYVFSERKEVQERFLNETSSGGVTVNDTLLHMACDLLPFGGVGYSGMGAYHGRFTFETFSHQKAVMIRTLDWWSRYVGSLRYASLAEPVTEGRLKFFRFLYLNYRSLFLTRARDYKIILITAIVVYLFLKICPSFF